MPVRDRELDLVEIFRRDEQVDKHRRTRETRAAQEEVTFRTETWGGHGRSKASPQYTIHRDKR